STGEIDLVVVLANLVAIAQKRLLLLFIFVALGIGFAYLAYLNNKPVFTTQMVLESRVINYADVNTLLEIQQALVNEENYPQLAQNFQVGLDQAKQIEGIKTINISIKETGRSDKDFIVESKFIIQLRVHQNKALDTLQKGIIQFLENNPYVKTRLAFNREQIQLKIKKIDAELATLDQLKASIQEAIKNPGNQPVYFTDLGELYQQSVELYEKKIDYETTLKFVDRFHLVEGFTEFAQPTSLGPLGTLIFAAFASILLWILLVTFLEVRLLIKTDQE
ncbi:MAG: hypothetical protein AAFU64_07775, partial [Bacteroidota bacterium]